MVHHSFIGQLSYNDKDDSKPTCLHGPPTWNWRHTAFKLTCWPNQWMFLDLIHHWSEKKKIQEKRTKRACPSTDLWGTPRDQVWSHYVFLVKKMFRAVNQHGWLPAPNVCDNSVECFWSCRLCAIKWILCWLNFLILVQISVPWTVANVWSLKKILPQPLIYSLFSHLRHGCHTFSLYI